MNINTLLTNIFKFIADLFYPPKCVICNDLYTKTSFSDSIYICESCQDKIRYVNDFTHRCKKCSRPIPEDSILCLGCQITQHSYNVAFSCLLYENEMRKSLLSYKFYNAQYKWKTYAEIMLSVINENKHFPHFDLIVSVPLSQKRKEERKFDHVAPFAQFISQKKNVCYINDAIYKVKETISQSKLTFKERFESVKGAYKPNPNVDFCGKHILLIDDIYTTGATVNEISKILKKKGAAYVTVLTLCIRPNIE